ARTEPPSRFRPEGGISLGAGAGLSLGLDQFIDERLRDGTDSLYEETLERMERHLLTRVLQHTGGNQAQAAKILGITRGSLRTKIREVGITITRTIGTGEEKEE